MIVPLPTVRRGFGRRAPDFSGQAFYLLVALRIAGQARAATGRLADDRRTGLNQFLDLLHQARRHRLAAGQDQHAVGHAAGKGDPAVLRPLPS